MRPPYVATGYIYDTVSLRTDGEGRIPPLSKKLFDVDDVGGEPSLADTPEDAIAQRWLTDAMMRSLFFQVAAIPDDVVAFTQVVEPLLDHRHGSPGDVDLLLVRPEDPSRAVAIECKRVKVVAQSTEHDNVNRVKGLRRGAHQANGLREKGFHRVWLAVLIVVDGRGRTAHNLACRGPTWDTVARVCDFDGRDRLHEDIGVVVLELGQPNGKAIDRAGQVSVSVLNPARERTQTAEMTNRVGRLLRECQPAWRPA